VLFDYIIARLTSVCVTRAITRVTCATTRAITGAETQPANDATLMKQSQAPQDFFLEVFMHRRSHVIFQINGSRGPRLSETLANNDKNVSHLDQEISGLQTPNFALFYG
jgi:hypothetical protein